MKYREPTDLFIKRYIQHTKLRPWMKLLAGLMGTVGFTMSLLSDWKIGVGILLMIWANNISAKWP